MAKSNRRSFLAKAPAKVVEGLRKQESELKDLIGRTDFDFLSAEVAQMATDVERRVAVGGIYRESSLQDPSNARRHSIP